MAKYLKIANRGQVPRELWELIGATSKDMDDAKLIGFKGSGAKFAAVPALRLGLDLIITSSDQDGPYTLRYFTRKTPLGFNRIYIEYNGKDIQPTSFTTNALLDWDTPIGKDSLRTFKLLREIITNAYDADPNYQISKTAGISPPESYQTCVYLSWHKEFDALFQEPRRYFKFMSREEPLLSVVARDGLNRESHTRIYPRSKKGETRVFIQGVLAYCANEFSAFDYCIDDKNLLSEEKILKDSGEMLGRIFETINVVLEPTAIALIMRSMLQSPYSLESQAVTYCGRDASVNAFSHDASNLWRAAWLKIFGDKTLLGRDNDDAAKESAHYGYKVLDPHNNSVLAFLKAKNVPSANAFYNEISKSQSVKIEELTQEDKNTLAHALDIFLQTYPEKITMPKAHFFRQEHRTRNGFADIRNKRIYINVAALKAGLQTTLMVLAHEYRHLTTEAVDFTRAFNDSADPIIAKLLIDKWLLALENRQQQNRLNKLEKALPEKDK